MAEERLCAMQGCCKPVHRRNLCAGHCHRLRKYGDASAGGRSRTAAGEGLRWLRALIRHRDNEGCVIWPFAKTASGYGHLRFEGTETSAHRVICVLVKGPPPSPNYDAAHSCNNRLCCNPNHVRWATKKENQADRIAGGTDGIGTRNSACLITESDVREIRRLRGQIDQIALAKMFGITKSNVSAIQLRKSWRHIV
jgi:hypothetical protein